jgi:hypothetical protein
MGGSHLIFIVDVKNLSGTLDLILLYLHILTMYDFTYLRFKTQWYISFYFHTTLLSSPRTGQAGELSQQKEYTQNSKVIWSLLIEYKISIWTQIRCRSLGSGQLLLLPYALQAFGFKQWKWERFTGVLYFIHHISLDFSFTNHAFISGVAPRRVQEHCMSTSCYCKYPHVRVPVGEAAAVINLFQNNINMPTALSNSCYNYVWFVS